MGADEVALADVEKRNATLVQAISGGESGVLCPGRASRRASCFRCCAAALPGAVALLQLFPAAAAALTWRLFLGSATLTAGWRRVCKVAEAVHASQQPIEQRAKPLEHSTGHPGAQVTQVAVAAAHLARPRPAQALEPPGAGAVAAVAAGAVGVGAGGWGQHCGLSGAGLAVGVAGRWRCGLSGAGRRWWDSVLGSGGLDLAAGCLRWPGSLGGCKGRARKMGIRTCS